MGLTCSVVSWSGMECVVMYCDEIYWNELNFSLLDSVEVILGVKLTVPSSSFLFPDC